jgi:hypothetical protein
MATYSASLGSAGELNGRSSECGALDRVIEAVREGESRALVARGEPGVGKTALLDYVAEQLRGCLVARAAGVSRRRSCALPDGGRQSADLDRQRVYPIALSRGGCERRTRA